MTEAEDVVAAEVVEAGVEGEPVVSAVIEETAVVVAANQVVEASLERYYYPIL